METTKQKKAVSPAKLAANRENARHSTGPRSEEGKNKSSQNAWRHGMCAKHLFPTPEQQDREGKDFAPILNGVRDHYGPVGFWEDFWAEKVAVEAFRSARVLSKEQGVFDSTLVFEIQSMDKILRYEASANRQLTQAIKHLEHLQEARRAKFQKGPSSHEEVTNPPRDQNEREEERKKGNQSPAGPDVPPSRDSGTNPTISDQANNPISVAPTIENCGTNPPRDQNKREEQPQKGNQSPAGPDVPPSGDYGMNPTPTSDWISDLPPGWPLSERGRPKFTNLLMPDGGGQQRAQAQKQESKPESSSH